MKKKLVGFWDYTVILTYLGFCSGIAGIIFALVKKPNTNVSWSFILPLFCLMFCGLCDTFDGVIAKTKKNRTKSEKRFGSQIDSLSDMVCFGILPAVIGYRIGLKQPTWIILLVFYCLMALIRLAYFNVEEIEKDVEACLAEKEAQKQAQTESKDDGLKMRSGDFGEEVCTDMAAVEVAAAKDKQKRKFYYGLPVTNTAWIFPLVFCFKPFLGEFFGWLYAAALFVVGVLFVVKFKIVKFNVKQALPVVILCALVFIGLVITSVVLELKW